MISSNDSHNEVLYAFTLEEWALWQDRLATADRSCILQPEFGEQDQIFLGIPFYDKRLQIWKYRRTLLGRVTLPKGDRLRAMYHLDIAVLASLRKIAQDQGMGTLFARALLTYLLQTQKQGYSFEGMRSWMREHPTESEALRILLTELLLTHGRA